MELMIFRLTSIGLTAVIGTIKNQSLGIKVTIFKSTPYKTQEIAIK